MRQLHTCPATRAHLIYLRRALIAFLTLTTLLLSATPAHAEAEAKPTHAQRHVAAALEDRFQLQGVWATQPRVPETGHYNWNWKGPKNDPEWAWFFNRHHVFPYVVTLHTQNPESKLAQQGVQWVEATLLDWIASNPPKKRLSFSPAWRALEAARRVQRAWLPVWRNLGEQLKPATKAAMLKSFQAHGHTLRHHHAFAGNHLITELKALLVLATTFPQFEQAAQWEAYAKAKLQKELFAQTYPSGAYKELANHYHYIALQSFQPVAHLLSSAAQQRIANMWAYFAATARPLAAGGTGPLNNDSDLEPNARILKQFGKEGLLNAPKQPLQIFPHAGQAVFNVGGLWAFFDAGPYGSAHQHSDWGHVSATLGAQHVLVDSGRYIYVPGPLRTYFKGPRGHNVVLLNGKPAYQGPHIGRSLQPAFTATQGASIINEFNNYTTASAEKTDYKNESNSPKNINNIDKTGTYTATAQTIFKAPAMGAPATWQRTVSVQKKGEADTADSSTPRPQQPGLTITDTLSAYGAHTWESLWHFHPSLQVEQTGPRTVQLVGPGGFAATFTLQVSSGAQQVRGVAFNLQKGVETGGIHQPTAGWYSAEYNQRQAAYQLTATLETTGPVTLQWVLAP